MDIHNVIMVLCILMLKCQLSTQLIVDVTKLGAVGNGRSDDTRAFLRAWNSVCGSKGGNPIMVVPGNKTFLVMPTTFLGPCSSPLVTVQVYGKIVAPNMNKFNTKTQWISFSRVNGLAVTGTGVFSGSGDFNSWWRPGVQEGAKPPTFRINGCNNVLIKGLTFIRPPRAHIAISSSRAVVITNIRIHAPETSPNTDGIDLSSTNSVNIQNSDIGSGDDCVAINGGCSNINITNVNCGPGHGISVGSLGKIRGVMDMVSNVRVKNCTFIGTTNAARIKTFNGGIGFARRIRYEDIVLVNSNRPIYIDQNYCVRGSCPNNPSKVKVSDVSFTGVRGTTVSKTPSVNFNCSSLMPCDKIKLLGIKIRSSIGMPTSSSCLNARGISNPANVPRCSCLK